MANKSAVEKVLNVLESGQSLTAKQISSRFRVANPHHTIYVLRNEGYQISLVSGKNNTLRYVLEG